MADHRDLNSSESHEPKHISDTTSADSGKVITPLSGGTSELRNLVPSEVGIDFSYGEMLANQNTDVINITAATDPDLYADADYVKVTSANYSGVTLDQANNVTFNATNFTLVAPVTGDYRIRGWFNISSDAASSKVGVRYTVNGVVGGNTIKTDIKDINRVQNISGFGLISLTAGDEVGVAIACDKTAAIDIQDFVTDIDLIRAT